MNILLIYPEFPDTFWSFKHAIRFVRKKAALPPLGLLTVGAMLPSHWTKRLVDLNVTELTEDDLAWAQWAFVGAMVVQRTSAHRLIARCKDAGLRVVAGGPLFVDEVETFDRVDHFILNEAEITLPLFLEDIEKGAARRVYRSTAFCDLHNTPTPLWELADLDLYASMSLQFSRGCPFDCEFCNITALFGRRQRIKTSRQVLSELDRLYDLGWRGQVFFVDDNFIGSRHYLKTELLPSLIAWRKGKKGLPFNTEASINLADDRVLMELMVQAGFSSVFIGIETPVEEGLAECNKRQNRNRDLFESVKTIQRSGLQVQAGFIVGFDSDSHAIFQKQREFIQKSGIVTAMVGLLQAPPGTRLYERLKGEGRLLGPMTGDNVDGTTNFVPKMDLKVLTDGYRGILRQIYAPEDYYRRVRTFLREYRAPKVEIPMDRERILAFFRSVLRLGVLGKERWEYWKTLVWTLLRKPRSFGMAITFAIYGHHFRKVSEHQGR